MQRADAANERKRPTQVHEALREMGDEMGLKLFISDKVENMGLLSLVSYMYMSVYVIYTYTYLCICI